MQQKLKTMLTEELLAQHHYQPVTKDILVVIRDQYDYVKKCIESIFDNTNDFTLHIWDNGSKAKTADFLQDLSEWHSNVNLWRCEENEGFILPNNILARESTAPFIILLNSDAEVGPGWNEALIGFLQRHEKTAAVGYEGGLLNEHGVGILAWKGREVDFVQGWCMALPRKAYLDLQLFDSSHLSFAYGEDADYCLRAKERGWDVYVLNLALAKHHKNVTTKPVSKERDLRTCFLANHHYLQYRHKEYLKTKRILLSYPEVEEQLAASMATPEKVAETFNTW